MLIGAFQRGAFQNDAFQVGDDLFDGVSGVKRKKRKFRLEDLYEDYFRKLSEKQQEEIQEIVEPYISEEEEKPVVDFSLLLINKLSRQKIQNYVSNLDTAYESVKESLLTLLRREQEIAFEEADRFNAEVILLMMLMMDE